MIFKFKNKKMPYILLSIIGVFFLYILAFDRIMPINKYINASKQVELYEVREIQTGRKYAIGSNFTYTTFYSAELQKYFILLYTSANRFDGFFPHIDGNKVFSVIVNESDLNDPDFGNLDCPIPIMNYKKKDKLIVDQEQYRYIVRKYLAYGRCIIYDKKLKVNSAK